MKKTTRSALFSRLARKILITEARDHENIRVAFSILKYNHDTHRYSWRVPSIGPRSSHECFEVLYKMIGDEAFNVMTPPDDISASIEINEVFGGPENDYELLDAIWYHSLMLSDALMHDFVEFDKTIPPGIIKKSEKELKRQRLL